MKIEIKKGNRIISSLDEWKEQGHPKSEIQWKDGRSSKEMARFALSESFKDIVAEILRQCNIDEQDFVCEPEAVTSLGPGFNRGGCRNHDLLMIGKDCIVGIEAKVSESFDKKLSTVIESQQVKYKDESKTRAKKLVDYFEKDHSVKFNDIGYQLFTSTRGTIFAASSKKYKSCINLVLVFTGKVDKERDYEKHCKNNDKDFNTFHKFVGASSEGFFVSKEGIQCWIKKVKVRISSVYEIEEI